MVFLDRGRGHKPGVTGGPGSWKKQETRSVPCPPKPRSPRKAHSCAVALVLAQWDQCQTSDLQDPMLRYVCGLKPLSLWLFFFFTAATGK